MNHLAHCFLSCENSKLLLGNISTDLMRKSHMDSAKNSIKQGIELHRAIDRFMDQHITTRQAIDLLRGSQKKYAPVSVDLLWDFYLVKNWAKYSETHYRDFCTNIYRMILKDIELLPREVQDKLRLIIDHDFLGHYEKEDDFFDVLRGMNRRARFNIDFTEVLELSRIHEKKFDQLFNDFFPEAIEMSKKYCDC